MTPPIRDKQIKQEKNKQSLVKTNMDLDGIAKAAREGEGSNTRLARAEGIQWT